MKQKLFLFFLLICFTKAFSQNNSFWQKTTFNNNAIKLAKQDLPQNQTYELNLNALRLALQNAPVRGEFSGQSNLIVSFPNAEGEFERFAITEASVMHPELAAKYPDIKSYAGQGIDDPSARLRFSISSYGFQSMSLSSTKQATFIEQVTNNGLGYAVYIREDKQGDYDNFECEVTAQANQIISGNSSLRNADDGILRTYRLAVSATGEYTQYHGGTKAQALAAINNTMTRVNGIFETDFNVTMQLIANTDDVIYTSTSSDPYGNTTSGYNSALQSTLTSVIGESNYDIGHLFANLQNNGNAGCIGCVCVNGQKGSGWTSATVPEGDFFDVDYVAHEMGHQFGANHTWTFNGNEGTNVQVEPGSGSTIMSYAGITGPTDVQANVHPNFHAVSIEQVTNYIKTTSCQTNTNTGNAIPSVNAGANYTIPRGTPFILEGSATDANSGDVLSYSWEQMDENNASTTYPSTNATSGVAFRAYEPTSQNYRYLPRIETIKTGATSWQWEAVPNVSRTLNFRLTVRDNVIGGGTNNSDDMIVTVNGAAGPFVVNSPNTNVTWNAGTTQTVTWNVAGTTANGINAANVDIFLSTDGGDTYPITLALGVTNDGSHDIVVPNNVGTQNRIMVRGSNNIFFDISNANFSIEGEVVCNATVPVGLAASNINSSSATLSWGAVPGASFDLQYRQVGSSSWTTINVNGISNNLSGLSPLTQYEARVRSLCPDTSASAYSGIINFTTTDVQLNYCTSTSTNTNDEYIGRVQLNTIDNTSGGLPYSDYTSISTVLTKGSQYTLTVTPVWSGRAFREGYAAWIDFNRDGDFDDAGEQILNIPRTRNSPVSGSFTIPASAVENSTRLRISMEYNDTPTSCETFTYGEVEDYTVIIEGNGPDTIAPVITLNGSSTINLNVGSTYTEQGATATDNIDGDLTSSIVIGGDVINTGLAGTYLVTYNVSDSAGNAAAEVIRTVNILPDTIAPVITLNGSSTINLNVGSTYTEQGATATDNIDGDLTSSIVIGGDVINTGLAGTYLVTYNVSDSAGNAANEVIRTVIVEQDNTSPIITLIGSSTINLDVGGTYSEQGATAIDNVDGDISANIVIGGDVVDTNTPATYFITYNVSDSAGNAALEVIRSVIVNPDSTAPIITLIGLSTVDISVGNTYTEQGATAIDNVDGDISANIIISGIVDTNVVGTYFITYDVSDAAGNSATEIRTINVNPVVTDIILNEGYFETGWDSWEDGGSDVARVLSTNSYEGSYSIRIRDNSGTASAMTLSNIDVTPYSQVVIDFYFYVFSMENGEDFWVRFYDGSAWNTVATYVSGSGISNNTFYNATVTLTPAQYNFAVNSGFRFQCDASGNNDQIFIDQVTITGTNSGRGDVNQIVKIKTVSPDENIEGNLKLYPNPVKGNVLNVDLLETNKFTYSIKNMLGQVVAKGVSEGKVDVSELNAGMYFIEVNDGEDILTKKFIRQ